MKVIILAAAAVLAMPALAQTSGSAGTSSPMSNGGSGTPTQTNNSSNDAMSSPSGAAPAGDPVGGYQPPMSGNMSPPPAGATVTYQQAQSPDQAYPAPAPMAKYPMCKPGQYDNCMQGSGAHKMAAHRTMRHHKK